MPVARQHLLQLVAAVQMVQRRDCLLADVVHAPEHRREYRQPHQDHHAFQIDGVAHVRSAARHRAGV